MTKLETIQNKEALCKLLDVARELTEYRRLIQYAERDMTGEELAQEMYAVTLDLLEDAWAAHLAAQSLLKIARRYPEPCIHGDFDCRDCTTSCHAWHEGGERYCIRCCPPGTKHEYAKRMEAGQ